MAGELCIVGYTVAPSNWDTLPGLQRHERSGSAYNRLMTRANKTKEAEWRQLEELVADIQRQLAPGATVTHNVSLYGHDSEAGRQIDVLVEQAVGQFHMRIVIDCKDYKHPVDVKGVEEFLGLVRDVRAHQGCLVSPNGFTKAAKKVAKRTGIALYSLVDTGPNKWQQRVALPMLCEFRSAAIGFEIRCSAPKPFMLQNGFLQTLKVRDEYGNTLGTCVETAFKRWNDGDLPIEPGTHDDVPLFPLTPYVDNGYGEQIPVELLVSLEVTGRRYFGYLPLVKIRGLKDEHTGLVHTNAFTTGVLSAFDVENTWQLLAETEAPPVQIALKVMGLDCYEIEGVST